MHRSTGKAAYLVELAPRNSGEDSQQSASTVTPDAVVGVEAYSATWLVLQPHRFHRCRHANDWDLTWGAGAKRVGLGTLILQNRLQQGIFTLEGNGTGRRCARLELSDLGLC